MILREWGGSEDDITIGKTYEVEENGCFFDDVEDPRSAENGNWEDPTVQEASRDGDKYNRKVTAMTTDEDPSERTLVEVTIDVYDVLEAFNVTCPALQHLIKKSLCVGLRGHKSPERDLKDIIESSERALKMGAARKAN
jgi:hypothetical protein